MAVVANATISFGRSTLKNRKNVLIASVASGLFGLAANPVLIILFAALLGMLFNGRQPVVRNHAHWGTMRQRTAALLLFVMVSASGLVLLYFFDSRLFGLAMLMAKIDIIAFGGGFASVPLMFHEVVETRCWMDASTFLNGIVLGQFTPGPIVITATFVGFLVQGVSGALIATIGVFLPSFLILLGIAPWFDRMRSWPWFTGAIRGILCSFVGLLFTVTIRFALNVSWDWPHLALATASLVGLYLKVDILWVVVAGTAFSALVF